jgi:hypothetical protein
MTAYARLTPRYARFALMAIAIATVAAVGVTLSPLANRNLELQRTQSGDVALYRAEVDRIHRGEGYYQAAAAELVARNYPTRSVFNWRMPLPIWLVGKLPDIVWGKALLGVMAIAVMLLAFGALAGEEKENAGPRSLLPAACALLVVGPLLPIALGDVFLMPVFWAGTLVALSVCAYGVDRPSLGVAFGLAAVFFRELAMPYAVVCMALAWHGRRRGEWRAWLLGLAAWGLFFALHAWQVYRWMPPDAKAHTHSWIQCGGLGFIIATTQMNAFLIALPQWVTAIYLVAALVGLAGWDTPLGVRIGLTTCVVLAVLALVGQGFNQYWGVVIAPLLCFGVARFPRSLFDLIQAAR